MTEQPKFTSAEKKFVLNPNTVEMDAVKFQANPTECVTELVATYRDDKEANFVLMVYRQMLDIVEYIEDSQGNIPEVTSFLEADEETQKRLFLRWCKVAGVTREEVEVSLNASEHGNSFLAALYEVYGEAE